MRSRRPLPRRDARRFRAPRALALALGSLALLLNAGPPAGPGPDGRRVGVVTAAAAAPPLRFGIYPGGTVGTVGHGVAHAPERAAARLAALRRLRGTGRDLVLHLYSDWTGTGAAGGAVLAATAESRAYTAAGFPVELVIRYRPARPGRRSPRAYGAHVRRVVRVLAAEPLVTGVQITNEANLSGAPAASDGAYPGVRRALVAGVLAAAREAARTGRKDLGVGFNWGFGRRPGQDTAFWRALRRTGGRPFARAVSWVGADVYPGTFSHARATGAHGAAAAMTGTLRYVRTVAMPRAGLGTGVQLRVAENGFPTGDGRGEAAQAALLRAAVLAVDRVRGRYGVTDYRWFDLRDAQTGGPGLELGYGILRSDYSEKPGFRVLAQLIQRLGR